MIIVNSTTSGHCKLIHPLAAQPHGVKLVGAQPFKAFETVIEEELAKADL